MEELLLNNNVLPFIDIATNWVAFYLCRKREAFL
jgi:hypothetical protein